MSAEKAQTTLAAGPCAACGTTVGRCLDLAIGCGDGDPGVCCADCDHAARPAPDQGGSE